MCKITTLRGKSPPSKNGESSYKRYVKWICLAIHETSLGYMANNQSQGSEALAQGHGETKRESLT